MSSDFSISPKVSADVTSTHNLIGNFPSWRLSITYSLTIYSKTSVPSSQHQQERTSLFISVSMLILDTPPLQTLVQRRKKQFEFPHSTTPKATPIPPKLPQHLSIFIPIGITNPIPRCPHLTYSPYLPHRVRATSSPLVSHYTIANHLPPLTHLETRPSENR